MSSTNKRDVPRRHFLAASAVAAATATVAARSTHAAQGTAIEHSAPPRRLLKTLKIGMVKIPGDLTAKFKAVKAAGYEGIELNSPGIDVEQTLAAIAASGLVVDGSVCSTHWDIRHSSPDATQRAQALADLKTALQQTKAVGGHTVLLVVGHGKDGTQEEVWSRSIDNIKQALPLCAELGMTIAIENVWNQFLYQHDGPQDQTADAFVKYVDQFDSPWVGMQFDIGNHWKYGNPADWIRTLGKRVVKLDIKGFSRQENTFTDITEDDLPWADVRRALDDIHFNGWVAAEVGGGDEERLKKIAQQIDRALNIG
ncbi:MAG: sugar phosphate isomerase/epimerase [Pirellulaceae bacterium]|jgi:L-ribulose-5-phosphate 3-epimerase|nr:sugar phosphate isomerase/epimerase [Pirellulaceae bacterium]